ncbi:MAG: AAA domain-containing protein [Candidatus Lokiarchaeota archaeon]|nr:AAA domain-containing protein [Candidatus Lokiarchaeota archaeon]MBD3198484.1 AAA domain-containing protein [Candidatus Lokiarchaeota archaeon]
MVEKVLISGVEISLSEPAQIDMKWVGNENLIKELKAAWLIVDKEDLPMNPRILGKPGVGKTTLAYATGKRLNKEVYIFQCTMDTRPEDLLISPVISSNKSIKYVASSLVSAMIKGGVCLLDEGNRMSEKSWASLAPLMDKRRYIESIIAGIRIYAHPEFRLCVTMNSDASTYEVPEYIQSRLQPKVMVAFPNKADELEILKYNLPFGPEEILEYCVKFLQNAHNHDEPYVVRDGIHIIRFYMKKRLLDEEDENKLNEEKFKVSISKVLEPSAIRYCPGDYEEYLKSQQEQIIRGILPSDDSDSNIF